MSEGILKHVELTDRFQFIPQSYPTAQRDDAGQLAFTGEASEYTHRSSLAEAADYNPPSFYSGIDFRGDELIDRGHRLQHARFVFGGLEVEAADVKPAGAKPMVQVLSSSGQLSGMSYTYHAGIVIPKFAVTLLGGLDWQDAGSGSVKEDNGLRVRQDPLDMGQTGVTSEARHGIAPPVPCIAQTLTDN